MAVLVVKNDELQRVRTMMIEKLSEQQKFPRPDHQTCYILYKLIKKINQELTRAFGHDCHAEAEMRNWGIKEVSKNPHEEVKSRDHLPSLV